MKTTIKTTAAILAMIMMAACSSDDSKPAEEPLSERLEYENTTETTIYDFSEPVYIQIQVPEDKIIIDPSKVSLEITLEHQVAFDLSYGYRMPNSTTDYKIVNTLGGFNKYSRENVLSFNPNHTEVINPDGSFNYPNQTIPAGNYEEGGLSNEYPVETPMFSSMLNKNIKGNWQIFFVDTAELDEGKVIKVKLIFGEGALEVTEK